MPALLEEREVCLADLFDLHGRQSKKREKVKYLDNRPVAHDQVAVEQARHLPGRDSVHRLGQ